MVELMPPGVLPDGEGQVHSLRCLDETFCPHSPAFSDQNVARRIELFRRSVSAFSISNLDAESQFEGNSRLQRIRESLFIDFRDTRARGIHAYIFRRTSRIGA